jgi:hypothetical protein
MRQGDYRFAALPYADFMSRLAAKIVDMAIVSLANLTFAKAMKDHTPLSQETFGTEGKHAINAFEPALSPDLQHQRPRGAHEQGLARAFTRVHGRHRQ